MLTLEQVPWPPHPQGGVQARGSHRGHSAHRRPPTGAVTPGCVSRMAPKEGHDYKVSGHATRHVWGEFFRCSQVVWAVEVNEAEVSKPVLTFKAVTLQAPAATSHAIHIYPRLGAGALPRKLPLKSGEHVFAHPLRATGGDQGAASSSCWGGQGAGGFAVIPSGSDLAPVPQAAVVGLCRRVAGVPGGLHPV